MPIMAIHVIQDDITHEQLLEEFAKMQKVVRYIINGQIDFENIRARSIKADNIEVGAITAEEIAANTITAEKMDVNELSAITANMGKLTSGEIYGAYIATSEGIYPFIEFNSTLNLLAAYYTANNSIKINPTIPPNPTLDFEDGTVHGVIGVAGGKFLFSTPLGEGDMQLSPGEDLEFFPQGLIRVESWSKIFSNLGSENQTMKQALDSKAPVFTGFTGSIPPGATIHVNNGVIQSYTL